jgi:hypothetical protein
MNIHRFRLERVTIYGNRDEENNATTFCHSNGFDIRLIGPRPVGGGKVDVNQFKIVAERKLKDEGEAGVGKGRQ